MAPQPVGELSQEDAGCRRQRCRGVPEGLQLLRVDDAGQRVGAFQSLLQAAGAVPVVVPRPKY